MSCPRKRCTSIVGILQQGLAWRLPFVPGTRMPCRYGCVSWYSCAQWLCVCTQTIAQREKLEVEEEERAENEKARLKERRVRRPCQTRHTNGPNPIAQQMLYAAALCLEPFPAPGAGMQPLEDLSQRRDRTGADGHVRPWARRKRRGSW